MVLRCSGDPRLQRVPLDSREANAQPGHCPTGARILSPKIRQHSSWDGLGPVSVVHVNTFSPVQKKKQRAGGRWFDLFYPYPFNKGFWIHPLAVPSHPHPPLPSEIPPQRRSQAPFNQCLWVHPPGPAALPPLPAALWGPMHTKAVVPSRYVRPDSPGPQYGEGGLPYPGEEVQNGYGLLKTKGKAALSTAEL